MQPSPLAAADLAFATALTESPRGPLRDGAFALWLVVRAALDGAASPPPARHGERLKAVAARLRSLNAPGPLRRALAAALADLAPKGAGPQVALNQLVAPTSETLGRRLAETVAGAARAVKH
jgi:hypothetical protein